MGRRALDQAAGLARRGEQLRMGMDVELEHGLHDPLTNVTDDDPVVTGKIALAHLNEFPDYYTRLDRMEEEAKRDHGGINERNRPGTTTQEVVGA